MTVTDLRGDLDAQLDALSRRHPDHSHGVAEYRGTGCLFVVCRYGRAGDDELRREGWDLIDRAEETS